MTDTRALRGRWPARFGMAALGAVAIGLGGAASGTLPGLLGFRVFLLGLPLGLVAVFGGAWAWRRGGRRLGPRALVLGALALAPILVPAVMRAGYPPINDISTDLESPPQFTRALLLPDNVGRDMALPAEFGPIIRGSYPDVLVPRLVPRPAAAVLGEVEAAARARSDWEVTRVDAGAGELEAVVTTGLFAFKDDVVVRVRPQAGGARVDVRSKSRVGKGDLGANAERIRWLWAQLEDR